MNKYFDKVGIISNQTNKKLSQINYMRAKKEPNEIYGVKTKATKSINNMSNCNRYKEIVYSNDSKLEKTYKCKNRHCLLCNHIKYTKEINALKIHFNKLKEQGYNFYYIVATNRHTKDDDHKKTLLNILKIKDTIMEIQKNYRKGKNKSYIGKLFSNGGLWKHEYTVTRNGFNDHINFLIFTKEDIVLEDIGQNKLGNTVYCNKIISKEYSNITGIKNSRISIKKIDDIKKGLSESLLSFHKISNYELNLGEKIDFINISSKNRLYGKFGQLYGIGKLNKKTKILIENNKGKTIKVIKTYKDETQTFVTSSII